MQSSVLLPDPLRPIRATVSPGATRNVTPSSARRVSNPEWTSLTDQVLGQRGGVAFERPVGAVVDSELFDQVRDLDGIA